MPTSVVLTADFAVVVPAPSHRAGSLRSQVRLASAAPAMLLTSFTYLFIGAHHWRKGASLWAVTLDTAIAVALVAPIHLGALAIMEVRSARGWP